MVAPAPSEPVFLTTVDTEEDQWGPATGGYSVENIRRVPVLHQVFNDLGLRPTYFTSYEVGRHRFATELLRELAEAGEAEIGAHLHPWNTPPVREAPTRRNTMLCNLPRYLQEEKLRVLTDTLTRAFGRRPTSFRAGRFGFGGTTAVALRACGYRVDCSVSPFTDLTEMDEGPDFTGAPIVPYWLNRVNGGAVGGAEGLLEIPVSVGYTRTPFSVWGRLHHGCERVTLGGLRLSGFLSRSGVVRKVALEPEMETASDMTRVALRLLESGVGHLQLLVHSTTLVPGLTPFTKTQEDVQRLLRTIETFVSELRRHVSFRAATVSEFAAEHSAGTS